MTVDVVDDVVTVNGPNGTMNRTLPAGITVAQSGDVLTVERAERRDARRRCTA